jgi:hypothetical protein
MLYFGCLTLLLVGVFMIAINLLGSVLNLVGTLVTYLWQSLCNLFRPKAKRRKVQNPFDTASADRQDARRDEYSEARATADESRPQGKLYGANDGEYIDFEEVD